MGLYDVALVTLCFAQASTPRVLLQPQFPTPAHLPGSVCLPLADLGAYVALSLNGWTTGTLMVELFSEDYAITHLDIAVTGSRVNQNLTWPCPDRLAPCLLSGYSF